MLLFVVIVCASRDIVRTDICPCTQRTGAVAQGRRTQVILIVIHGHVSQGVALRVAVYRAGCPRGISIGRVAVLVPDSSRRRLTGELSGGYVTTEGGEMQLEFKGAPNDALPVKDFLVPQLNAARERDVQATFILTFNPGMPLAGDAAEKLGERLAKFVSGAAYVSATAEAVP